MKVEQRQIKASMYAGITDIIFGLIMYATGAADWYFEHFHFFGILGIGMIFYSVWLLYFYLESEPKKKLNMYGDED